MIYEEHNAFSPQVTAGYFGSTAGMLVIKNAIWWSKKSGIGRKERPAQL